MKILVPSALLAIVFSSYAWSQDVPVAHAILLREGESITLPDAPPVQPKMPGFWSFGSWNRAAPLRTNHQILHDKSLFTVQTIWLGSIVYDAELTHQGLAHHKCVEGSMGNNLHPSRAELYRSTIPEYTVGTAFNWLMMKYMSKSLIMVFPSYSATVHLRGGTTWLANCW